ncbi:MAG: cobalamin-dependent protein [Bacillota bacterium]
MHDTSKLSSILLEALININRIKANALFEKTFAESKDLALLEEVSVLALKEIGQGWESGEYSLSQVYMSGIICEELLGKFLPMSGVGEKPSPKMAIVVLKDYHSLGKKIVKSVLHAGGYKVMDFGQGLDVETIAEKTVENDIEILLVSTLMITSALQVMKLKERLKSLGSNAKIVAGGAPFRLDTELWEKVGADADGKNATDIIGVVEALFEGGKQP